jgi:hypothetical protein
MMRLLLTSFVQSNDTAKMYGIISVLETAGLFNEGLNRDGTAWLGLPIFCLCGIVCGSYVGVMGCPIGSR